MCEDVTSTTEHSIFTLLYCQNKIGKLDIFKPTIVHSNYANNLLIIQLSNIKPVNRFPSSAPPLYPLFVYVSSSTCLTMVCREK